jgi:hypothetical protein
MIAKLSKKTKNEGAEGGEGEDKMVMEKGLTLSTDTMSSPWSLISNPHATIAAFIRTLHTEAINHSIPHSLLFLWHTQLEESIQVAFPAEAEEVGAINAQECWWLADGRLGVLWSTAYTCPGGSVVGANADNACYLISIYHIEDNETPHLSNFVEIETSVGPFLGRAKMASPSQNGEELAVIVRKSQIGHGANSSSNPYQTAHFTHNLTHTTTFYSLSTSTGKTHTF